MRAEDGSFTIRMSFDPHVKVWVAEVLPGGPDCCAQGSNPWKALERLAATFLLETSMRGDFDAIPVRPAEPRQPEDIDVIALRIARASMLRHGEPTGELPTSIEDVGAADYYRALARAAVGDGGAS